jgi:hypothetical protein
MGKLASFAFRPSLAKRGRMTQMTVMTQVYSPATSLTDVHPQSSPLACERKGRPEEWI